MKKALFFLTFAAITVIAAFPVHAQIIGPAVGDSNLLSGLGSISGNVAYSSQHALDPTIGPANLTDGLGGNYNSVFSFEANTEQSIAITGFDSTLGVIRIWSVPGGSAPLSVTIYGSTNSTTSLNSADYALTLVGTTTLSPWSPSTDGHSDYNQYKVFNVSAPAGTQSLLFDFGVSGNYTAVAEFQAFAAIPEPSTWAMLLLGMGALVLGIRRRQGHLNF
jgi:hypothetical protein